jgi:hypothetical protein
MKLTKICTHTRADDGGGRWSGIHDIGVPHGISGPLARGPHSIGGIQLLGPSCEGGVQC